jgi:gliding motility-associated-like protein
MEMYMKSQIKSIKANIFILFALFLCNIVDAQQCKFSINYEALPSTCVANGSVKVTLSGDEFDLSDVFIILTDGSMINDQITKNGHTFESLPPGEYTITARTVYKGTQTSVSCSDKVVVESQYVEPNFALGSERRSSLNCINSGLITINIKNATLPYKVEITSNPDAYTDETVFEYWSQGTIRFDDLPPGNYSFTITDACESGSSFSATVGELNADFPTNPYQDYLYPNGCNSIYVSENWVDSNLYPYWNLYREFYEIAFIFDDDDEKNYIPTSCCSQTFDLPDTYTNMHAAGAKVKVYLRIKGTECEQLVDEIQFSNPPQAQIIVPQWIDNFCDSYRAYFYLEDHHILCTPYKWEIFDESNNPVAQGENVSDFDYLYPQSAEGLLYNHDYTLKVTDANGTEIVNLIRFEKEPPILEWEWTLDEIYSYDLNYSVYNICIPYKWEVFDADSVFIKGQDEVDSPSSIIEDLEYDKEYIINIFDDSGSIISFHYKKDPPYRHIGWNPGSDGDGNGTWSCETFRITLNVENLDVPFTWKIMNSDGTEELHSGTDEDLVIPFGILEYGESYIIEATDGISTVSDTIEQDEVQHPVLSWSGNDFDFQCNDYAFRFSPYNLYCFPYKWELFDEGNNLITGKYGLNVLGYDTVRLEYDKRYYVYITDNENRTLLIEKIRPANTYTTTPYIDWRDHEDRQCFDYEYSFKGYNVTCFPYKWEIFESDNPTVPFAYGTDLTKDDLDLTVDVRLEYSKNYTVKITDNNGKGSSYSQYLSIDAISYNITSYNYILNCEDGAGYIQIYDQLGKPLNGVSIHFVSGPQTPVHTDIEPKDNVYNVYPFSQNYLYRENVQIDTGDYVFEITDKCGETQTLTVSLNKTVKAKDFRYTLDEATDVCDGVTRLYPRGELYVNGNRVNAWFSLLENPLNTSQPDISESNNTDFFSLTVEGRYVIGIKQNNYSWDCAIETIVIDHVPQRLTLSGRSSYVCEEGTIGHILVQAKNGKPNYTYTLLNQDRTPVEGVNEVIGDETNNYEGAFEYGSFGEKYIVKVEDYCGNFFYIEVSITTIDPKTLLSGPENVCKGEDIELSCLLLGAEKYTWSGPNGFSEEGSRIITIPNVTVENSGEYTVEVVPEGCPNKIFKNSININVHDIPPPDVSSVFNLCQADADYPLTDKVKPDDDHTVDWYDESGELLDEAPIIDLRELNDYVFYVSQTDELGCIGEKKKIDVKVNPLPVWNAEATGWSCQNDNPTITVTNIVEGYVYTIFADAEATETIMTFAGGTEETVTDMILPAIVQDDTTFYLKTATGAGCTLSPEIVEVNINVDRFGIMPDRIPVYKHDVIYSIQLATEAEAPVFSITDGNLLEGISMNVAGLISGTVARSVGYAESTFVVTVTDVNGCKADKLYTLISCGPAPEISDVELSYCKDAQSVPTLEASSPKNFPLRWYDEEMKVLPEAPTPKTDVVGEQIFYVTQFDEALQCESDPAEIKVQITPLPQPELVAPNVDICYGDSPVISLSELQSDYVYDIYSDILKTNKLASVTGVESDEVTLSTVPQTSLSYYIFVTDNLSCVSKDFDEVKVDVTKLEISPDRLPVYTHEILYNVQLESNAEEGVFSYVGALVTGISMGSNGLISGIVPESAGFAESTFTVTVTDKKGCKTESEYLLRACEPPPHLLSDNIVYCQGTTASPLEASSPNGNTIQWYDSNMNKLNAAPVPSTHVAGTQIFYVSQINEALQCEGKKAQITVLIKAAPPVNFDVSADSVCVGNSPVIKLENIRANHIYSVYSNKTADNKLALLTGVYSGTLNVDDIVEDDTNYYVFVTDSVGCTSLNWIEIPVKVIRLYIKPEKLPLYYKNTDYEQKLFTNAQSPVFTVVDGSLPEGLSLNSSGTLYGQVPSYEYSIKNVFAVKVLDSHGCSIVREYTLHGNVFVPKIFTPNGDGVNDVFMPNYKLVIFDRLGIEIFKGDNGWDGTYKGKLVTTDIYFYKLEYVDSNGITRILAGYVGVQ